MHPLSIASFLCALASVAGAQAKPIPAKAFLPDGHDTVLHVDMHAVRERGILDELDSSALKLAFPSIEQLIGFPIASLDRATMVVDMSVDAGPSTGRRRLVLLEGRAPLLLPDRVAQGRYEAEDVAGHALHRNTDSSWSVFVQPQPTLQVMGHEDFVLPVLEGKKGSGMPSSDVMSLLSGRGDSFAYAVFGLGEAKARKRLLADVFEGSTWPADDEPTHILLRLRTVGEADDPHVEFEAVLRHRNVGDGIAVSETAVDAFVARLKKEGQLVSLRPLWKGVQKRRDHGDLCASVDLGRVRDAMGHAGTLALPFLLVQAVDAQAAVGVPVPVAPVPAPLQPPKK